MKFDELSEKIQEDVLMLIFVLGLFSIFALVVISMIIVGDCT